MASQESIKTKKKQERFFLFHGRDDYTTYHQVKAWIEAFAKKHSAGGIIRIQSDEPDELAGQFEAALDSPGLFATTRLVLVREAFQQSAAIMERFLERVDRPVEDTFVIFWEQAAVKKILRLYKKIESLQKAGLARIYSFEIPTGAELDRFIRVYAQRRGISFEPAAVSALRQRLAGGGERRQGEVRYTLWQAASEIDKLGSYSAGRAITAADVEEMVAGRLQDDVFALTQALASRNHRRLQQLLDELLNQQGSATEQRSRPLLLVGALAGQFRSLLQLHSVKQTRAPSSQWADIIYWPPYRLTSMTRLLSQFDQAHIESILGLLAEIDQQLKSSALPPKLLFSRLFVKILSAQVQGK